jgi:MSHA type pilus biogenesis protein MshL
MSRKSWALLATTLFMAGCVNPTVSTIRDTNGAPSYVAPKAHEKVEPPRKDPNAYRNTDPGHTYSLTLKNAELKDVLMLLSKESGIPIVAERGLVGHVNIEAQNRKLGELLYSILKPLGYTATVENGIIQVGRPQLVSRIFRVNYIKDKRNSSSNTNVSGFSGSGSSGSVTVSTEGKSDFWGALEGSLEMLVFGSSGIGKREGGGYIRGEAEKKIVGEYTTQGTSLTPGGSKSSGGYDKQSSVNLTSRSTFQSTDIDDPMLQNTQISQNQLKQLVVNETAGIILVTDYTENLDRIASFLADVEEGSKRQVLIQAHIMEVNLKDFYSLGIDWKYIIDKASNLTLAQSLAPATAGAAAGATAASSVFKISAAGSEFGVFLDAMKEQGNINMLSSPKISALNNQKAVIKLTTKQVSWVSSKTTQNNAIGGQDTFTTTPQIDEVGIFLDVTPQIGHDNSITMQIHPSVSEIREISTSPDKTSTKPIIDVREVDTMVDAKTGETIVIAGLISDKLNETKRSVPLLGDIPYLGTLFSYNKQERTKSELVIMMTPYILNAKNIDEIRADHEKRMCNMGGTFHLIDNLGSMVTEHRSHN